MRTHRLPQPCLALLALLLLGALPGHGRAQPLSTSPPQASASAPVSAPASASASSPVSSLASSPASAPASSEAKAKDERFDFVVGLALNESAAFDGSRDRGIGAKPVWAFRWGRVRVSSGGGGGLLGFVANPGRGESEAAAPGRGASVDLVTSDRLSVRLSARFDQGRDTDQVPELQGLPAVDWTVRARLSANYNFNAHWGVSAAVSQDVLGRGGGALGGLDVSYVDRITPATQWSVYSGLTVADQRYTRSYLAVSPEASLASGLPEFSPGAGVIDVHAGLNVTHAWTDDWLLFGGVGLKRLVGDAAASPITRTPWVYGATVGLAWRCCRW